MANIPASQSASADESVARPLRSRSPSISPRDRSKDRQRIAKQLQLFPTSTGSSSVERSTSRALSKDYEGSEAEGARIAILLARKAERDQFLVTFAYNDREDPRHFRSWRKWQIILVAFAAEMWANVISSIYSVGVSAVAADFHVSESAARIPQAVYLYGFAFGPVLLAPLSEDYGRWTAFVPSMVILSLCQLACALAPNLGVLIVFRLLAGFFASATFNSVGLIDDMWTTEEQAWATNTFALSAEIGAVLGPMFSGALLDEHGWRWLFGVSGIVTGALLLLWCVTVPETRAGVLLSRRAKRVRKDRDDDRYYALHEKLRAQHTATSLVRETLVRPLWMLCEFHVRDIFKKTLTQPRRSVTEPIVFYLALLDGYAYSIVYCALESVPLVYNFFDLRHQALPFVGIAVGFIIGFVAFYGQHWWEQRAARRAVDGRVPPEERLAWGTLAGVLFPVSLFYFAWTAAPKFPSAVSITALGIFGFASHVIFISVSSFTITSYGPYAASAVAAQSFLRELLSGSVTLVTTQMYRALGDEWASSLLAFLAVPLSVIPIILYVYGSRIRARSTFAEEIARSELESRQQSEENEADHWSREQSFATRATAGAAPELSRGRTMTVQMSFGGIGGLRGSVIPETDESANRSLPHGGVADSEVERRVTFVPEKEISE